MKKKLAYILIIASVIVMMASYLVAQEYNLGFWMSMLSSVLVITSMVLTISNNNKQDNS